MSSGVDAPQVTGLSPAFGPTTGNCQVVVRGSDLGLAEEDVVDVTFCGISCRNSLVYHTPTKLQVLSPPGVGSGPVIVTTRSGGEGTCLKDFVFQTLRKEEEDETVGMLEECDVWKEEECDLPPDSVDISNPDHVDGDPLRLGLQRPRGRAQQSETLKQLAKLHPDASGVLSNPNFVPGWCLVETYRQAKFADFKKGLRNLDEVVQRRSDNSKELVNNNLGTLVSCFEALSSVHDLIGKHKANSVANDITLSFEGRAETMVEHANEMFGPLLERQKVADKDRNAVNVLKSYKFLFNLPRTLKKNIRLEQWPQVIQDYKKAKTLFADTKVDVFRKVLQEVEEIAASVRELLYKRLEVMPTPLADQERYIELLRELGTTEGDEDPGWFCLTKQQDFIQSEIDKCVLQLQQALSPAVESEDKGRKVWGKLRTAVRVGGRLSSTSSDGRRSSRGSFSSWRTSMIRKLEPDSNLSGSHALSVASTKRRLDRLHEDSNRPQRVVFIERLSRAINDHMPSYWRLGLLCCPTESDKNKKRQHRASVVFTEQVSGISVDCADIKRKRKLINDAATEIVRGYVDQVRQHFVAAEDEEVKSSARSWLPKCEGYIRACHRTLGALGLPESALSSIGSLLGELHTQTVSVLFHEATKDISMLEEDWKSLHHGGCTQLPKAFESILVATVESLSHVLLNSDSEALEDNSLETLFCESFNAFTALLEQLVSSLDRRLSIAGAEGDGNDIPADHKLMCTLANASHVLDEVQPNLVDRYAALRLDLGDCFKGAMQRLMGVQRRCFDELIQLQGGVLSQLVRASVEGDWSVLRPKQGVRSYVKEILVRLVIVHRDMQRRARVFCDQTLAALVALIGRELSVALEKCYNITVLGARQLQLEVFAIEATCGGIGALPTIWEPIHELLAAKLANAMNRQGDRAKPKRALPKPGQKRSLPTPGAKKSLPRITPKPQFTPPATVQPLLEAFEKNASFQFACFQAVDWTQPAIDEASADFDEESDDEIV